MEESASARPSQPRILNRPEQPGCVLRSGNQERLIVFPLFRERSLRESQACGFGNFGGRHIGESTHANSALFRQTVQCAGQLLVGSAEWNGLVFSVGAGWNYGRPSVLRNERVDIFHRNPYSFHLCARLTRSQYNRDAVAFREFQCRNGGAVAVV